MNKTNVTISHPSFFFPPNQQKQTITTEHQHKTGNQHHNTQNTNKTNGSGNYWKQRGEWTHISKEKPTSQYNKITHSEAIAENNRAHEQQIAKN